MDFFTVFAKTSPLAPAALMFFISLISLNRNIAAALLWKIFALFSSFALIAAAASPLIAYYTKHDGSLILPGMLSTPIQFWIALLVQLLGTVIGIFSSRYLQGEHGQAGYVSAFSGVLSAVHVLLLADHWLVLIFAWAAIGFVLKQLLCFYPERPFAMLAAHKKHIADRVADILLIAAAALAWWEVGSGSLGTLFAHVAAAGASSAIQFSVVLLVLAVVIRTALLPVHGWLIQVMEAPTPVSALLHAGVVNLAGFVLIRFATLLDASASTRWLLVVFGLTTAVLAGLAMLTRVSIKVRLAWSTVAQMGFMVLECGLGLYTLAAMHLIGHSLYKAHAFLSASGIVQQSKLQLLRNAAERNAVNMLLTPLIAISTILLVMYATVPDTWPWWWSAILALAWSPLLWTDSKDRLHSIRRYMNGAVMIAVLTLLAVMLHQLPFGTSDMADAQTGIFALVGMLLMYATLVMLQLYPERLTVFQRWSYAGFYVDEAYTRLTLKLWPINWASAQASGTLKRSS